MTGRIGRKILHHWRLIAVLVVVGAAGAVAACTDGFRSPSGVEAGSRIAASKKTSGENPFDYVGKEHNAQVDYVLREFSKQYRKNMKTRDICAALDKLNDEYLARKGKSGSVRLHADSDPCRNDRNSSVIGGASLRVADMTYDGNFSPAAVDLVNQVEWIVATSGSAGEVASRLGPVNSAALGTLGGSDLALVLSISAIAENSSSYWQANLGGWADAFVSGTLAFLRADNSVQSTGGRTAELNFDWSGISRVSSADIAGGIGGALKGVLGGPEGVAAGAVTGAAYSSIGAAIGEILRIIQKT